MTFCVNVICRQICRAYLCNWVEADGYSLISYGTEVAPFVVVILCGPLVEVVRVKIFPYSERGPGSCIQLWFPPEIAFAYVIVFTVTTDVEPRLIPNPQYGPSKTVIQLVVGFNSLF